jgi:hypothetical protein
MAEAPPPRLRCLIIVAREAPDLRSYLLQTYGGITGLQVLLDRRQDARRQRVEPHTPERRLAERRRPPTTERDLRRQPFLLIPQ